MNYKILILVAIIGGGIFFLVQTLKRTYHENITSNLNMLHQRLSHVEQKTQQMETEVSKIVGTVGFHELFNKVENHGLSDILGNNDAQYDTKEHEQPGDVSDAEYMEESIDDDSHIPDSVVHQIFSSLTGVGVMTPPESNPTTVEIIEEESVELPEDAPVVEEVKEESPAPPLVEQQVEEQPKVIQKCQYVFRRGIQKGEKCPVSDNGSGFCTKHQPKK